MSRRRISRPWAERTRGYVFLLALHAAPVSVVLFGAAREHLLTMAGFYAVLSLSVGVGLHRYFAHRSFRTSRPFQFLMGLASTLTFTDPIGFAGKHRLHHRYADDDGDTHNPDHGFWYCWFGSLIDEGYTDVEITAQVRDLTTFPELVWLHRYRFVPPVVVAATTWLIGGYAAFAFGYFGALALLVNLTSGVNYVCHRWGTRPYPTHDRSRNNLLVALWSFGEGWHNNHHYYPGAARAGFAWWEFDPLYVVIRTLETVGLVRDVRDVPERVRRARRSARRAAPRDRVGGSARLRLPQG